MKFEVPFEFGDVVYGYGVYPEEGVMPIWKGTIREFQATCTLPTGQTQGFFELIDVYKLVNGDWKYALNMTVAQDRVFRSQAEAEAARDAEVINQVKNEISFNIRRLTSNLKEKKEKQKELTDELTREKKILKEKEANVAILICKLKDIRVEILELEAEINEQKKKLEKERKSENRDGL